MQFTLIFLQNFVYDLFLAGPVLLFLVALISLIGFKIGRTEGWSPTISLYHAFINATTVGYGDFRPTRASSRMLGIVLALTGLIFTGIMVAIAVHAFNLAFSEIHGIAQIKGD